uniref:Uncharacterized protein n=1 Tax=Arundo donax TaxID=35708 RepID=A0A0A9EEK5_ARUDO
MSDKLKPQSDTCSTASSTNGCASPWRTDSATFLSQNALNIGPSSKALSFFPNDSDNQLSGCPCFPERKLW